MGNFKASPDRIAQLFEHAVYNKIRNSALANDKRISIKYFRTRNGLEVDFVVQIENTKIAIEAKTGQINQSDIQALLALQQYDPSIKELYLVGYKETERRKIKSVTVCGLNELIKSMGL